MSKYIIDTDNYYLHEFDGVLIVMMHEGKPVSVYESKDNLEELNSDYINENFGELQDAAYQKGYDAGIIASSFVDKSDEAYQRGLEDAWEAARKIVTWPDRSLVNSDTFDLDPGENIFVKYSASEAIAKLKAYEEKQKTDDKFEFGDEIIDSNGEKGCVVSKGNEEGDTIFALFSGYRTPQCIRRRNYRKTGKHYDIQSILEAMKNG